MAQRQAKPNGHKALTSIPEGIHCAATPEYPNGQDELEEIAIDHFLDTLAEVAMAIANRRLAPNQKGEPPTE